MSVGVHLVDGATTLYAWGHEPKTPGLDWRGPVVGAVVFFSARRKQDMGMEAGLATEPTKEPRRPMPVAAN